MNRHERRARLLALLLPAALLAGAWASQLIGELYPCEMCHWQRWPHYAALVPAALAFLMRDRGVARMLIVAAAAAIAVSGAIGVAHAGVEYHWWDGFTACTSTTSLDGLDAAARLDAILRAPIVRCDVAQWSIAGVSLAGFNAILSLGGAATILWLLARRKR
jgi:disulfide bond formation protein DsbB